MCGLELGIRLIWRCHFDTKKGERPGEEGTVAAHVYVALSSALWKVYRLPKMLAASLPDAPIPASRMVSGAT